MSNHEQLTSCQKLVRKCNILVLATSGEDGIHTSLMAYASSADCNEIYMVSSRKSRKWKNLSQNPQVSLLIDDRDGKLSDRRNEIKALTVKGIFIPVTDDAEIKTIKSAIAETAPAIADAFSGPENSVIRIKADSFQLLNGPQNSFYIDLH
ncbi:pyridoxamine 5'-phosphate oxidase family protein [Desulfovibrio sp. JC022]|uniref:pyridoxamine 5'-phosphate oxidase family protein n=1 Tax=Desulfovibrio sp. JC022 TaxID=2593642 RepID=UPI0013CF8F9F|nr:pyridoxamine 5'-phosphate oxidase family protein [Desulfovibrio sp. JC022]NDV22114.1 pyridoxamine 5'-phosphate oxidase family protein [Desulfovibrio sp. JC022]